METENEKIIFLITKRDNDLLGLIGYSGRFKECFGRLVRGVKNTNIIDEIDPFVETTERDETKKYILSDGSILFIMPNDITNLHTQQHPLIIFNDENIVDIDEWWYSPFKKILNKAGNEKGCEYTFDLKNWKDTKELYERVECGNLAKFRLDSESNEDIYAIKAYHITFS